MATKILIMTAVIFLDHIHSKFDLEFHLFQLILLMALAKGQSRMLCGPLTLHTQTAIHVARLMTKVSIFCVIDQSLCQVSKQRCGMTACICIRDKVVM